MRPPIACSVVLMLCAIFALGRPRPAAKPTAVAVTMHNVMYHFTPGIAAHIFGLSGWLAAAPHYPSPVFDDARSFVLHISAANMSISSQDMSSVLNRLFAAPDAPLKEISIATRGQTLKITGKLHAHGDIPFEEDGALSLTPQGEIRIHSEKVRAAHLPVKGLMDLLGVHISSLISTRKIPGLRTEKDDLLLNLEEILPLPRIAGRLSAIHLQGEDIVVHMGGALPPLSAGNYMIYRGGQLRFGKLTMDETDMTLLDLDPQDPFDFYLASYRRQLVAGYTKTTPAFGLRVYMRDYNKLQRK